MKRHMLYPLVFVTVSLVTGLSPASPVVDPSPTVAERAEVDAATSRTGRPTEKWLTAPADEKARLQEIREHGKQQAARAAFDLAALSFADGDRGRSAELLREAVTLQPENSDYLIAASRMAFALKDYKYAEAGLVKFLSAHRGAVVGDGTKLLIALDNLAKLYRIQGKAAAAKFALNEALLVETALYGENHPMVIHGLYRLAELDLVSANYGEARHHLRRAVDILDASPSPIEDQDAAALLHNIGELYRVSGHANEAESAYTKAMALWNKSPATNQRGIDMTQAGLEQLHANPRGSAAQAGLTAGSQVEMAPPVSSLLPEATQAQM